MKIKNMKLGLITQKTKYASITMIIIILLATVVFLRYNFYDTITQSKQIEILQKEVSKESVNMDLWNKIIENLNDKNIINSENKSKINPFDNPAEN
jgi:cell division protein FtsB